MTPRPYVSVDELKEQVTDKPSDAEDLVNSLIRSIGRNVQISAGKIHWDFRTNLGDGGKDLVVDADHNDDDDNFLPKRRSYWSIKSGDDGRRRAKFRSEIRHHPKVKAWLAAGNKYVWCCLHPATEAERKEIEDDRSTMVAECSNSFTEDQIEFRWIEQVRDAVNLHPAVALHHVPIAMNRRGFLLTLDDWKDKDTANTQWVDFDQREELVNGIVGHFLSTDNTNVVHIAGMSGIGKSRLVREACTRLRKQHQIESLYCESYELIKPQVHELKRLFGSHGSAILVLDEVPFGDELSVIEAIFRDVHKSVRLVTISPTVRQTTQTRGNRILIGEPSGAEAVLSVIKQSQGTVSDERLKVIASKSAQDLRFALTMVHEINRDPSAEAAITGGAMPLLDRIVARCGLSEEDRKHLIKLYDVASCFIDIGVAGDVKEEIDSVKLRFALDDAWLGIAIGHARDFGLSVKSKNYLEATPRGLAELIFAKRGWNTVSRDLAGFFESLPVRLQQRFVERCQDCSEEIREEVQAQLGNYFLGSLREVAVLSLERPQTAKIFTAWAKFDPMPALTWLQSKVDECSTEALLKFTGNTDYGDYRGRRYIIWLCESLARFPNLFFLCESVLFKLAIAENEPRIGNNATKVWRNLFWPTLSQVSIPFADRAGLIQHRLRSDGGEARKICIDCALEAIQPKRVGMAIPPRIVGGRLAPEPWRANSTDELLELRAKFAKSILQICSELTGEEKDYFINAVIQNLMPFAWLDLIQNVRSAFGTINNEQITTELVAAIRRVAKIVSHEKYGSNGASVAQQLRDWEESITPAKLADRVKFWIQQNPWDLNEDESEQNPFELLAEEIVRDPTSLLSLVAELSDRRFNGTMALATYCGGKAKAKELDELIEQWIARGEGSLFVTGFLLSRSRPDVGLDEEWRTALDSAIDTHPEYVGSVTMYVDASEAGYRRIAAILDNGFKPVTKLLSQVGFGHWTRALNAEIQLDVCKRLSQSYESEPSDTIRVAIDLLFMWTHVHEEKLPQHLYAFGLKFLEAAIGQDGLHDCFKWVEVARQLVTHDPQQIAELALEAQINRLSGIRFDQETLDELVVECARKDSKVVMKVLGELIQDKYKNAIYSFHRHEGVFETIGVKTIEDWCRENGDILLKHIASHLASPSLADDGAVVLSDVLQWLFTTHEFNETAFRGFLSGRHRMLHWWGDEKAKEVEEQMQSYLKHELRRVREWAAWETNQWNRMQEWFDEVDEKRDRS